MLHWDKECLHLVVDVGGSHGLIARILLATYPNIGVIVEDRLEVVEKALVPAEF